MSEPLKVGVVGLGIRGFWVAHMTRGCPETRLVAMADMRPEILDIARDKFPDVDLYASGEEMARDAAIDAVFVTTGDRFHAGNAREALRCGKHVLIEKPMAQSFADLEEIARLKQETGLTVGTFLELRHSPLWQRTREILESGTIGRVLSAALVDHVGRDRSQFFARRKARSRDQVVSLVLQKGVHSLDLLNWFVASSPRRVSASGGLLFFGGKEPAEKQCRDCPISAECPHFHQCTSRLAVLDITLEHGEDCCVWSQAADVEDVSLLNIEYASGVVASYREVHFAPYYGLHFTLYGEKGQLDVEANHDTGEAWIEITERYTRRQYRERPTRDTGHTNADGALIADFARAAYEEREPLSGLRAGFESAAVAIGCRQSLDTRAFVDLPMLEGNPA